MLAQRQPVEEFIWSPQAGPQYALFDCDTPEVFFGGSRGGGKTDGVLGKWAAKEEDYGEGFNAIMFRRTTVSSSDAIDRSKQIFGPLGGKFNESKLTWRMPHGGRVAFGYLDSVDDAAEYQGRNLTDAWIEEAGQYPSPDPIFRLFGAMRTASGAPVQMILTGNPGGPGQSWIRDRYEMVPFPTKPRVLLKPIPDGSVHEVAVIPSRLSDNRILMTADPTYVNRLQLVGNGALVKAWLEGDWNAIEGAFFDEWNEAKHIVTPFPIPSDWLRFRSMDWGSASPFCCHWWAVAGDDYDVGFRPCAIPRGALVLYREWYGSKGDTDLSTGLKLTAEEVGRGIKERSPADEKYAYSVIDPSASKTDGGPSITERIGDEGRRDPIKPLDFIDADNKRVPLHGHMGGWDQMRARLKGTADGVPMLYVFSTCRVLIKTLPLFQHDPDRPEDIDTGQNFDHALDSARYACMSRPWVPAPPPPDPVKSSGYERTGGMPEKSWRI